jgi:hypothetical protein
MVLALSGGAAAPVPQSAGSGLAAPSLKAANYQAIQAAAGTAQGLAHHLVPGSAPHSAGRRSGGA